MALVWRRNQTPNLETQLWKVIPIDGNDYLIKGLFDELGYHVMVCDRNAIWEEKLDSEKITKRSKSLNPNVEAPLSVLLCNLSSNLEGEHFDATYAITVSPSSVTLTLNTTLVSLPFQWEFVCTRAPHESFSEHLITPMLCMVSELSRRHQELAQLLTRKDKEIQDYKDHGAKVSRPYLETIPFDEKAFHNEMITSSEFTQTAQLPFQAFINDSFRELYRDIVMVRAWASRKDEYPPLEAGGLDSETTGTWAGKIPASLLPAPPPSHTHTSPTRPPKRLAPVEESPSKDDEHTRREALERKLEDEKTKSKKKKKKLM